MPARPPGENREPSPIPFARLAAALPDGLVAFLLLSLAARRLGLPWPGGPGEIVSAVTREGFFPWTNHLRFLVVFAGTLCALGASYRLGPFAWKAAAGALSRPRVRRALAWAALALVVGAAGVNFTATDLLVPLEDAFHEGEILGFLPAAKEGRAFSGTFLVHGGIDVFPALAADRLARPGTRIIAARLAVALTRLASFLLGLLATYQAARLLGSRLPRFDALCIVLPVWLAILLAAGVTPRPANMTAAAHAPWGLRDLAFLAQLCAVLAFFRRAREPGRGARAAGIAALTGALVPLSFLHAYDRAVYMAGSVIVLAAAAGFWRAPSATRWSWAMAFAGGGAAGAAAVVALAGPAGALAILEQVAYWGRTSARIWTVPLSFRYSGPFLLLFGTAVCTLVAAAVCLAEDWRRTKDPAAVLEERIGLVVMATVSLAFLRTALERSDQPHILWGSMPSLMLLASACAARLDALWRESHPGVPLWGGSRATRSLALALGLLAVLSPLASPREAARILEGYARALEHRDEEILPPDVRQAAAEMAGHAAASRSFLALNNEGIWYFLLNRPSCSRFHHLAYARTAAAQQEVIAGLEALQPEIVLMPAASEAPSASGEIDGVSVFDANAPILRYAMEHYRPFRLVGGRWFWRRAAAPWRFDGTPFGSVTATATAVSRRRDATFGGRLDPRVPAGEVRAVLVTVGDPPAFLWAGILPERDARAGRWRAVLPTASLPPGPATIRFWAVEGKSPALHPLGGPLRVTVL